VVTLHPGRAEAMCRLLIESGDMTPLAAMQLRKLWETSPEDEPSDLTDPSESDIITPTTNRREREHDDQDGEDR
jgi:hypothetical protein